MHFDEVVERNVERIQEELQRVVDSAHSELFAPRIPTTEQIREGVEAQLRDQLTPMDEDEAQSYLSYASTRMYADERVMGN